ncbi:hypothetical protein AB7849_15390 [Rhodanobacter sp. 115]
MQSLPKWRLAPLAGLVAMLVASAAVAANSSKPSPAASAPANVAPKPVAAAPATAPSTPPWAIPPVTGQDASTQSSASIPTDDDAYNHLIAQLDKEHYVLTLESQNADLKKKIADAQGASLPAPSVIVAPPASMTPQSGVPGAPARGGVSSITFPDPTAPAPVAATLRLVSVLGIGGSYQANVLDHGVDNIVHTGSTLSDGWHVEQIAPSTVELVRGRRHRILHVEP